MKIRRTVTRREFYVRTAGWFTVLKPDTRFPALHQQGGLRNLPSPSTEMAAMDVADSRKMANSLQIIIPTTIDRRVLRPAPFLAAMMRKLAR